MGKITDYLDSIEGTELYRDLSFWKRWGEKELRQKLDDLGSTAFARGYQMDALAEGDFTFQNFHKVLRYDVGMEIYEEPDLIYVMGVDVSSSRRPGSVCFTAAITPQGYRYPVECRVGKWSSPQFVANIKESYNIYHHQTILVENNAVQTMLVEWLEHDALYLPVEGYLTGAQKWNPENGLPSLDVEFQKGLWLFPMIQIEGHDTIKHDCGWCTWIREMTNHPGWITTDTVMATWFVKEAIRLYWSTGFYEETPPDVEGEFNIGGSYEEY